MFIPNREAVKSLLALTKYTKESAYAVYETFSKLVKAQKLDNQFKDFLSALWRYALGVDKQRSLSAPFDGKPVPTPEEVLVSNQYQARMPNPIPEGKRAKELSFDIMNQAEGKVDRKYNQPSGAGVSDETRNYLDYLFQLWMAKNNITRKDHVMYGPNQDGDIVRLSAADLQQRMAHAEHGFERYVREETRGEYGIVKITISEQIVSAAASVAQTPVEQETPSSTAGGGMRGG